MEGAWGRRPSSWCMVALACEEVFVHKIASFEHIIFLKEKSIKLLLRTQLTQEISRNYECIAPDGWGVRWGVIYSEKYFEVRRLPPKIM